MLDNGEIILYKVSMTSEVPQGPAVPVEPTGASAAYSPVLPGQKGATILRIYTYKSPQLASFVFALTIGTNALILALWVYLFFGGK